MCKFCEIENETFSEPFMSLAPDVKVSLFKDTCGNLEMVVSNTFVDSSISVKMCPMCSSNNR